MLVLNASDPSAVVVAVPPFAAGMTPVRESVVVEFPPEVAIVEVIFPEPMTLKLITLDVPLNVETYAVDAAKKSVVGCVAIEPSPRLALNVDVLLMSEPLFATSIAPERDVRHPVQVRLSVVPFESDPPPPSGAAVAIVMEALYVEVEMPPKLARAAAADVALDPPFAIGRTPVNCVIAREFKIPVMLEPVVAEKFTPPAVVVLKTEATYVVEEDKKSVEG